jgi:hypothetical protein
MKTRGLSTILAALAISAAGFAGPAAAGQCISPNGGAVML